MSTQRSLLARDLLSKAGSWPKAAACAAVLTLLGVPSSALAQPAPAPVQPRDPMKAGKDKDSKVVVSEHMTVDLHVKDEDLSNVLELLSIQTQKNIIASKNVGGKVTATLYGVTFYQALDAILHVNGYGYTENGNFIYTKEELTQIQAALKKKVSKVIKLNYLNAEDAKEFVSPLLSKEGGEIKVNSKVAAFSIPDKAPVGKNDFALTDTLVVIDFEENVKAIEELVKQIDTRPAQVLVEATILQTSLNEANAFGVDFSIIGDLNFTDFINIGGPLGAAHQGRHRRRRSGLQPAERPRQRHHQHRRQHHGPRRLQGRRHGRRRRHLPPHARSGDRHGHPLEPEDPRAEPSARPRPRR
jgi:type II secretory pathway component GspD/PulD (secretin)